MPALCKMNEMKKDGHNAVEKLHFEDLKKGKDLVDKVRLVGHDGSVVWSETGTGDRKPFWRWCWAISRYKIL